MSRFTSHPFNFITLFLLSLLFSPLSTRTIQRVESPFTHQIIACPTPKQLIENKQPTKYPFYRPEYEETPIIFEEYVNLLSFEGGIISDELLTKIGNHFAKWKSYHNFAQFEKELIAIHKLSNFPSFRNILQVSKPSQSEKGRDLYLFQLTDFNSPKFISKVRRPLSRAFPLFLLSLITRE